MQGGGCRSTIMTKAELVEKIKVKAGLESKLQAEKLLAACVDSLQETLAGGESVVLTGFGTFKVAERAARKVHNPRTKEEFIVPASMVVKFVPGKQLKEGLQSK